MKFRAEGRLKTISFVFLRLILKLIRNGPCLNVLEFFLDGDGTVLRYQNRGVVRIFKDANIGRECLEIHRINQVSSSPIPEPSTTPRVIGSHLDC